VVFFGYFGHLTPLQATRNIRENEEEPWVGF